MGFLSFLPPFLNFHSIYIWHLLSGLATELRALTQTFLSLLAYAFSAMRIQVSSAFLQVTQKRKGGISTNTLKGSVYKDLLHVYGSHCLSEQGTRGPWVSQRKSVHPSSLGATCRAWGSAACPSPSLPAARDRGVGRHWLLVHRRNMGIGICKFHICTVNSLPLFLTD